jgi:hypothetical protein
MARRKDSEGKKCGARLRNKPGRRCRNPAGFRSNHVGEGKCWLHGGATPIKHGRYSTVTWTRVADLLKKAREVDDDPTDLHQDLYLLRALIVDFVNRYYETNEALLAWHHGDGARPRRVLDITAVATLIEKVAKLVTIIERQRNSGTISLVAYQSLMEQMAKVVVQHVPDQEVLARIDEGWRGIVVNG